MGNLDMSCHDILPGNLIVHSQHIPVIGVKDRLMTDAQTEFEALRNLDPQAITNIHHRYYPEIFRFAQYRLGDEVVAEDITGDVFVRLLEAVHAGRGPQTNLRGWLIGTTSNLVNDHFRRQYSRPQADLPEDDDGPAQLTDQFQDPSGHVEKKEQQGRILTALNKLTEEQKRVITLRFGIGYNLEETAVFMGKKANAIKALQFRALAALRRALEDEV
jgi:RNA polymerase sigma-70 factor (ECF subfamily)